MLTKSIDHVRPTESPRQGTGARSSARDQLFPKSYGTSTSAKMHFAIACQASAIILRRQANEEAADALLSAASRAATLLGSHGATF